MFRDFLTLPLKRAAWLVDGIWGESAHGVLAGEPKTYKSLFTYDLAISIASGTPFLGTFQVPVTGPVIIVQEENTPGDVHDRLMRISTARGVGPAVTTTASHTSIDFGLNLPIHLLNNEGFSLTDEKWMQWLERQIRTIKPALVVLDPLYLMAKGIDENSASEMTPILSNLLRLKQKYNCGILVVHHYNKPKSDSPSKRQATRISGTGVFHRWLASAIYVEVTDEANTVKISGEHRSHGSNGSFRVQFDLGGDDDLIYAAHLERWSEADHTVVDLSDRPSKESNQLAAIVAKSGALTVSELADRLGLTRNAVRARAKRAGLALEKLSVDGKIQTRVLPASAISDDDDS